MRRLAFLIAVAAFSTSGARAQTSGDDAAMQRRLALSDQFLALTHKMTLLENLAFRALKPRLDALKVCSDEKCESILDQTIRGSLDDAAPDTERAWARIYPTRLTEDELDAAIKFAKSPQGNAVLNVQDQLTDDFIPILRAYNQRAFEGAYRSFCAKEAEACSRIVSSSAMKPAS